MYTLRMPTTRPTKVALDLGMEQDFKIEFWRRYGNKL